jgi:hypothetical protein
METLDQFINNDLSLRFSSTELGQVQFPLSYVGGDGLKGSHSCSVRLHLTLQGARCNLKLSVYKTTKEQECMIT